MSSPKAKPKRFLWPTSHSRFLKLNDNSKPVYEDWTTADKDEIFFPGSDDDKDDPEIHRAKRRRREDLACDYLAGRDLHFVWTKSKGPWPKDKPPRCNTKVPTDQNQPAAESQGNAQASSPHGQPATDADPLPHDSSSAHVQQYDHDPLDTWSDDQDFEAPNPDPLGGNALEQGDDENVAAPDPESPAGSSEDDSDTVPNLPSHQTVSSRTSNGRLSSARGVLSGHGITRRRRSLNIDHAIESQPTITAPRNLQTEQDAPGTTRPDRTPTIFSRNSRPSSKTPEPRPGDVFNRPSISIRPQATPSRPPRSSPLPTLPRPAIPDARLSPRIQDSSPNPHNTTDSELTELDSVDSPLSALSPESVTSPHPQPDGDSVTTPCSFASRAGKSATPLDAPSLHDQNIVEDSMVQASEEDTYQPTSHGQYPVAPNNVGGLGHAHPKVKPTPVFSKTVDAAHVAAELRSDDNISSVPSHTPSVLRESFAATVRPSKATKTSTSKALPTWDTAPPASFTPINKGHADLDVQLDKNLDKQSPNAEPTKKPARKRVSNKIYQVAGPSDASPFVFRKPVSDDTTATSAVEAGPSKIKKSKVSKILFNSSLEAPKPNVSQPSQRLGEEFEPAAHTAGHLDFVTNNAVPAINMSFDHDSFGVDFELINSMTNKIITTASNPRKKKSELRKAIRESGATLVGNHSRESTVNGSSPQPASLNSTPHSTSESMKDLHISTQDRVIQDADADEAPPGEFAYFSTQVAMAQAHRDLFDSSPEKGTVDESTAINDIPAPLEEDPPDTIKTFQDINKEIATETQMPMPSTQALLDMYSPIVQSTRKKARKKAVFANLNSVVSEDVDESLPQQAVRASVKALTLNNAVAHQPSLSDFENRDIRSSMSPDVLPPSQKTGSQPSQREPRQSLQPPSGSISLSEVFNSVSSQRGGRKLNSKALLSQEPSRQSPSELSRASKKSNKAAPKRRSLRSSLRHSNPSTQEADIAPPSSAPPLSMPRHSLSATAVADEEDGDIQDEIVVNCHRPPPSTMPDMRREPPQASPTANRTDVDEDTDTNALPYHTYPDRRADQTQSQRIQMQLNSELTPLPPYGTRFGSTPGSSNQSTERIDSSCQPAQRAYGDDMDLDATIDELTRSVLTPWADVDTAALLLLEASF